jgi:hypothetical protein
MTGDGRELDILYSVWIADGHLLLYATQSPRRLLRAVIKRCQAVTSRTKQREVDDRRIDVGTGKHCVCCATYLLHQAYAPYRCSASFPSHPHWGPCQAQAEPRLHRATGEEQEQDRRRRHIAVGYTSGAEAAGRVGVGAGEDGGGSGSGAGAGAAVEGRHLDWGRRLQQQEKGLPGHSHKQVHTSRERLPITGRLALRGPL